MRMPRAVTNSTVENPKLTRQASGQRAGNPPPKSRPRVDSAHAISPALGLRAGCPLTLGRCAHSRTEGDPRRFVGLEVNHRDRRRFGVAAEGLSSAARAVSASQRHHPDRQPESGQTASPDGRGAVRGDLQGQAQQPAGRCP